MTSRRRVAFGFVLAVLVLSVLVTSVGLGSLQRAFSTVDFGIVLLLIAVSLVWLTSWGLSLQTVLGALGVSVSRRRAIVAFTGVVFANSIAPFGQVGGEPLASFFLSRSLDTEYETSLATVAGVDTLNFVPSTLLAVGGLGFLATRTVLSRELVGAALSLVILLIGLPTIGVFVWRYRRRLTVRLAVVLATAGHAVARLVPRWTPPDVSVLEGRIGGFFAGLERLAGDRRALARGLGFSTIGWLALATVLWLSLFAFGLQVSPALPLVVVPLAMLAVMTPLPGGVGGVEAAMVVFLVAATGMSPVTATAATLVYRGATYWLPILLGGVTVAVGRL